MFGFVVVGEEEVELGFVVAVFEEVQLLEEGVQRDSMPMSVA